MALLVLYMVNRLLLPGQVEYVAGFAAFRGGLEFFTGPLTPLALASLTFGLYSGFALAFDRTVLVALLLLVIGSGFLKGNISAQVGALYRLGDEARRTRGFAIFRWGLISAPCSGRCLAASWPSTTAGTTALALPRSSCLPG